jgi:preprotein translocase subunit SecA
MSEINAMTNEELITKTREFEAEIRKGKTNLTRMQNEIK